MSPSEKAIESLRELAKRVALQGRILEVQQSARKVYSWLQADPETLVEPYQDHNALPLTEYGAFEGPLISRYAIPHASK